jgi:hypothetical protein
MWTRTIAQARMPGKFHGVPPCSVLVQYSTVQIAQSPTLLTCVSRWNPDIETGACLPYLGPSPWDKGGHQKRPQERVRQDGSWKGSPYSNTPARRGRSKDLLSHSKSAAGGSVGRQRQIPHLAPTPRVTVQYCTFHPLPETTLDALNLCSTRYATPPS